MGLDVQCSRGIKYLVKVDMENLTELDLNDCCLGNQGMKHLLKGKWPNLQHLSISGNQIGFDGWSAIYCNQWKDLRSLYVQLLSLFEDEENLPSIALLHLHPSNWTAPASIQYSLQTLPIKQETDRIINSKFSVAARE